MQSFVQTLAFFMASGNQPLVEKEDEDRILSGRKPRKSDVGRFVMGRNGDDLLVPFECDDDCVFGKLFGRDPDVTRNPKDLFAMGCIRRVIATGCLLEQSKINSGGQYC